jgi:serine/threonine protein kinase/formylglycine-generating enzyme required for sulfatase activity
MMPIEPGLQIGRYIIRHKLGAGGMAEVFLADDTQLGRRVALKFLPAETASDDHAQRRLLREARAAATLDHPHICSVFEVADIDGRPFIAMQYVDGQALDVRMRRSPLDLQEVLSLAVQVVDALSDAHGHGILHRDIKPSNIMLTARGQAKVMDFGLAKLTHGDEAAGAETVSLLSARGEIVGTAPYMSPEQARGEPLDARSDIFSTGVLLYEMVAGQRPFQGGSSAAVAAAILTHDPPPLARFTTNTPPELERIVSKALKKDPDNRYQTAKDLLIDLRSLKEEEDFQLKLGRTPTPTGQSQASLSRPSSSAAVELSSSATATVSTRESRPWSGRPIALAATILVVALGGWFAWHASNVRWARAQLPQIAALVEADRLIDAYDLAIAAERYLPGDSTLAGFMPIIADTMSVTTTPPDATVYIKRFNKDAPENASRQRIGTTPLANVRVARGEYVLSIEREGYAPTEQTVSGLAARAGTLRIARPPIRVERQLMPTANVPDRMVFVPGGDYRLASWSRPSDRRVRLSEYFIDKYEVSNRDFKAFIDSGGYLKRDFWKHPFVKDGQPVSWDEAMKLLVDRTGLPGPRSWSNQSFPDGKADHPVTDVSWYEAEAYAAFQRKRLPTAFEWEKAARDGLIGPAGTAVMPWGLFLPGDVLTQRANFGSATLPTMSAEFGMSPFGAYNMAGNVAEWTFNDSSEGYLATGGAWGDPTYSFSQFGGRPGFFSSEKLGFRCARLAGDAAADQGRERIEIAKEVPQFTPSSKEVFTKLASRFHYDKTPLDARVEETIETAAWRREKVTFNGANNTRAIAYLYLPNHVPRPLQVIHFLPAGDVDGGFRSLPASIDERMAPFIRGGRAVFGVVLEGYNERLLPAGVNRPAESTIEFADFTANRIIDLRRGLDYLETRPDIETTRMAAMAPSAGSVLGLILGAIETRYRAIVFIGAGLPASYRAIVTDANPIYFTPHIRIPKLVIQGRYDEDTPLRSASEPMMKLMVEPKRLTIYDGGHVPSVETTMNASSAWLDENLGRVMR